ncbi:alpha-1,4-glucan--maltose-1-phosphate maltosyltransferase [Flaviflexus ciconiae]|uniref:alpha-1,4-glucan--maltose-1-phosphate maltosyltransferase n=1 Tax=Flaviflexus ciconiae TaxID=2496867 RepID=UPI002249184E|nr:alpha-1,4-glucan--maltose-1-phosphate maltosyltransferase [Flaviflexus ciconiae]
MTTSSNSRDTRKPAGQDRRTVSTDTPTESARPRRAAFAPVGRIPIIDVSPVIEDGRWPAKATVGEAFPVRGTVFREGHDEFSAEAVLTRPDGTEAQRVRMVDTKPGLNRYEGWVVPDATGTWSFHIESWSDPYRTWEHNATVKIEAGVDERLMIDEGIAVLTRAAENAPADSAERTTLAAAADAMKGEGTPASLLTHGLTTAVHDALSRYPLRDMMTYSAEYLVNVDRELALYGSWYEFFPRSAGAFQRPDGTWVPGTLKTATEELDRIKAMGFTVAYLTPIHPIGSTNRKGRNNTLTAEPGDPGSPYGIGSEDGGHDTIHPDLGTFEDFDRLVARARELDLEVALDIALQASPDHPWVTEHPEWFTTRLDGTIAYAENPPKKYQDIYPLNFDNDPEGIYVAIRDMLTLWADHGVTLFRIDNPHTKPLPFWQRLLAEFRETYPDVIFLAEAFTKPPMLQTLGAIGFHQSYNYFAWRNEKTEIEEYLMELAYETDHLVRPAFWPTTHDILTPYMQRGGVPAFAIRAILAATGAPTWGIYSGYELAENIARPGAEEQIDNEKYQFKSRDYGLGDSTGITPLLTKLNAVRAAHPALQRLRNVTIHPTTSDKIICFSKKMRDGEGKQDTVIVALNLDPFITHDALIDLDFSTLGLGDDYHGGSIIVDDELTGQTFEWGQRPFVRLDPHGSAAHILSVRIP